MTSFMLMIMLHSIQCSKYIIYTQSDLGPKPN